MSNETNNEMIEREILECDVKANVDNSRVLSFVGTTSARDRMGDEISARGWDTKAYRKNPVFLWAHSYAALPIGRTLAIEKQDNKLVFDVEFATAEMNPLAEQVFQLYKAGFLRATSVGFRSLDSEWINQEAEEETQKRKKDPDVIPGKKFKRVELLELSAVPVPANPEALMIARRKGLAMPPEVHRALDSAIIETKPGWDESENEYRYRVRDPGDFKEGSFRTITIKKDKPTVRAVIGKLKSDDSATKIQALRFPRDEWDLADAKEWLKDHGDLTKQMETYAEEVCCSLGLRSEPEKSVEPQAKPEALNTPPEAGNNAAATAKPAAEDGARPQVTPGEQSNDNSEDDQFYIVIES